MSITKETRQESYDVVKPNIAKRRSMILEVLGNREMTATEIAIELQANGNISNSERNSTTPRLTEMKDDNIVEVVGKKYCGRTGRRVAVWKRVNLEEGGSIAGTS